VSETLTLRERLARYDQQTTAPVPTDARLSRHQQQPEELITVALERLRANPDDLALADWVAYLLYANRRYDEAIPLLEQLVRSPKRSLLHIFHLANACHATGDQCRAVELWEQVALRGPGTELARKAVARMRFLHRTLSGA
jgi:tetratricopeptide (TPR) repeat protein